MRCLAVCQTELVGRLLHAVLSPRVEVEFVVESKALARRLYVMDQGRVIAEGEPTEVLDDPRVHEAYMGGVV